MNNRFFVVVVVVFFYSTSTLSNFLSNEIRLLTKNYDVVFIFSNDVAVYS